MVVRWPEATRFSVGPPDFKKWWSDRPPDYLTAFVLFGFTNNIFSSRFMKEQSIFWKDSFSLSVPIEFHDCWVARWLGSGLLLPGYLKLILNTIRYSNLNPWTHFVIIVISFICRFSIVLLRSCSRNINWIWTLFHKFKSAVVEERFTLYGYIFFC